MANWSGLSAMRRSNSSMAGDSQSVGSGSPDAQPKAAQRWPSRSASCAVRRENWASHSERVLSSSFIVSSQTSDGSSSGGQMAFSSSQYVSAATMGSSV